MRTWYAIAGVFLSCAAGSAAPLPPQTPPPKGPPPTLIPVVEIDPVKGTVMTQHTEYRLVPVQVPKEVELEGKKVVMLVTESRPVSVITRRLWAMTDLQAFTADGKPLPPAELGKRLVPGALLLSAAGDELPEPAYLKLFKPDTVVVVFKQPKGNATVPIPPIEPKR
jgi:hypothetical protein